MKYSSIMSNYIVKTIKFFLLLFLWFMLVSFLLGFVFFYLSLSGMEGFSSPWVKGIVGFVALVGGVIFAGLGVSKKRASA